MLVMSHVIDLIEGNVTLELLANTNTDASTVESLDMESIFAGRQIQTEVAIITATIIEEITRDLLPLQQEEVSMTREQWLKFPFQRKKQIDKTL